ncbi:MAG: hypothetical protein QX189_04095 [Methylococcales bacterium]
MSIQKEFVLRYRIDGHIRFQIPAKICEETAAKIVTDAVLAIEGVYRVTLYRKQQKLSIRFQESACDFKSLAQQLFQLLADLEKTDLFNQKPVTKTESWREKTSAKLNDFKVTRWAKEKYSDAKETVQAAKIITKLGMSKPKSFVNDPEKAMIDFFNDVLVLFLIKLHWTNITQQWLLKPLKYRYEWMALFYMVFLLVRSRRKK